MKLLSRSIHLLLLSLIVIVFHLVFFLYHKISISKIQETKLSSLGTISDLIKPRNLFLVYGSITRPKQYFPDLDYDIIVISCFLNKEGEPDFSFNHVLISVARDIGRVDPKLAKAFLNNIVNDMREESKQKGYIYLYRIPKETIYFRKTKIHVIAAIPLFKSSEWLKDNSGRQTLSTYRKALKHQIREGVKRISLQLPYGQNLYSIAFPALAASSTRNDSYNTMSYKETFSAIFQGIQNSKFPDSMDSIYLVIYNELRDIEFKDALNGFLHSYHQYVMGRKVNFILAFATLSLCLGMWSKLKKAQSPNWFVRILIPVVGLIIFIVPVLLDAKLTFIVSMLEHLDVPTQIALELLLVWVFYQLGTYWFSIKTIVKD